MYCRWADRHGVQIRPLSAENHGEYGGFRRAVFRLEGPDVYARLGNEGGLHRLVRISPFDAQGRRHTTFTRVCVYPDVPEDVMPEDFQAKVYRPGGPCGQHVNTVPTGVLVTHLPTGRTFHCDGERSQMKNATQGKRFLRAELARPEPEAKVFADGFRRSYILQPYTRVHEPRTGNDITGVREVEDILDGGPMLDRLLG